MTGWVGAASCFVHLRWASQRKTRGHPTQSVYTSACICPWRDASWAPPRYSLQSVSADWSKAFGKCHVYRENSGYSNKSSSRHWNCVEFIVKKTNLLSYAQTNLKSNQTTNDIVAHDCHDVILRMSSTDSYRSGFHSGWTCRKSNPVQVTSSWRSCSITEQSMVIGRLIMFGILGKSIKKQNNYVFKWNIQLYIYIYYITQSWKVSARVRNVWTGASHQRRGKECQKCEEHNCLVMPESDTKNDEMCELLQNQSHRVLRIQKNAQDRRPSGWTEKQFAHHSQSELQKTTCLEWKVPLFTAHQAPGLVSTHWGSAQGCHWVRRRKFWEMLLVALGSWIYIDWSWMCLR